MASRLGRATDREQTDGSYHSTARAMASRLGRATDREQTDGSYTITPDIKGRLSKDTTPQLGPWPPDWAGLQTGGKQTVHTQSLLTLKVDLVKIPLHS